jgi:hypothetical protein
VAVPVPVKAADSGKVVLSDSGKAAVGIDSARSAASGPVDSATSTAPVPADSAKAPAPAATSAAAATAAVLSDSGEGADSSEAKPKARTRPRIVRETTVNTIDELKGKYRSPKKALFMSMIVPGLGQAYVGHGWFNYTRGAAYFLADVAMIVGWHHYVVDRQNAQIDKYQKFADKNWSQAKYEDSITIATEKFAQRNQHRESYCDYVQERATTSGNTLYQACLDPKSSEYSSFRNNVYQGSDPDSVSKIRSQYPNTHGFYELIGKEQEFITGWSDANAVFMGDSAFYDMGDDGGPAKDNLGRLILATTADQQTYISMRAKANDYARMQAYFLGGIVVNHIVSAIDAALSAHYHNKSLYETETTWYDRLRLDSRLAWSGYAPVPTVTASFTF